MWIDRLILTGILLLVFVTFGLVAHEQLRYEIRCIVSQETLLCPPGVTWKYTRVNKLWQAENCCP